MSFRNLLPQRRSQQLLKKRWLLSMAALVVVVLYIWLSLSKSSSVFQFVFSPASQIKSTDGRVNILLLGNAGGTHQGASLTDSMIVASYHLKTHRVILISIPRDLYLQEVSAKVNTLYQRGGLKYTEDKTDNILGIPIHYGVRLNFTGFAKAIDLIGGVEIDVPKTFDDYNYPIAGKEEDLCGLVEKEVELTDEQITALNLGPNSFLSLKPGKNKVLADLKDKIATQAADFACRFEHIYFGKGEINMNGATALKFVRSRSGTNGEGSDFARSRRQQLVLQAFRDKVLSAQTLVNPQKVSSLITTFGESLETDIPAERALDFYNLVKKTTEVQSLVLGDLGNGQSVLVAGEVAQYGSYVLIPSGNDFSKVHQFLKAELQEQELNKED